MTHISEQEQAKGPSGPEKQDVEHQDGGEDEGSSSQDGHDRHLHEDQKPLDNAPASLRKHDNADKPDTRTAPA